MNYILLAVILSVTPSELVSQLGSADYQQRELAHQQLVRDYNPEILTIITSRSQDCDPEIRHRIRLILKDIRDIDIPISKAPQIWFLPSKYRYPGFERDVALECFKAVKHQYVDVSTHCDELNRAASLIWAGDMRELGWSINQVQCVFQAMKQNESELNDKVFFYQREDLPHEEQPEVYITDGREYVVSPMMTKNIEFREQGLNTPFHENRHVSYNVILKLKVLYTPFSYGTY